ncbi:beta strand repeat-containing protein [Patescibacteria group bacterium]
MSKFKKTGRLTSAFLSVTTAVWLSGAAALMPVAVHAQTIEELQAQISSLLAMISTLQAQLSGLQSGGTSGAVCGYTFSTNLSMGDTGADVMNLQKVLNSDSATQVAASGIGSSGSESSYFGSLTKGAVIKFQDKYASEVLTPIGLSAGTGYVGSMSRAKLNALYGTCTSGGDTSGGDTSGGDTTTPTPVGTGLTVTMGTQPGAGLFPVAATRVPFTVVNFTASADGDVTVDSIVVERTGLLDDDAFSGVALVDENDIQIGLAKTLNSSHQVTLSEDFVVKAGSTRTMTIVGNALSAAPSTSNAGQAGYLSLITVNSSATVNGLLPITGSSQTINETLTIGSITNARGPLDPNADADKEVGTTGYTFTSIRITAGSAEKVRLHSIRWNQSGSASADDMENVKTYIDGTAYDTIVSSDGKYYTSTFSGGILIDKGFSKEIYVKGDVIGGSARTIAFDLYKTTDLYLTGETYKYGLTPPTSGTGFATSQPWYNASVVTVAAGSITVSKGTAVEAQNVAINVSDQPLGGFHIEVKGEPVSVGQMVFNGMITNNGGSATPTGTSIDNVTLYDANGSIVAGPVDATGAALVTTITFTDTVTFPVGKGLYTLKGKLSTNFESDDTFIASTTPDTDFSTVTGQTTGVTITPAPTGDVTANTMTVKAGALAISVSSLPLSQTIIAGVNEFNFANYVLDAGNSGEDVALTSLPLAYDASANPTTMSNCALWEGGEQLITGSNVVSPTAAASGTAYTFDTTLVIPKGTSKTLALKCDVAGNATANDTFEFGYDSDSDPTPTGITSGQDVSESETDSVGQTMTIAAEGTYTVDDDSTPGYTVVSAGATGVTLLKLKFAAVNEDIDIERVNFQLSTNASNTPLDLIGRQVTLWDGSSQIGTAEFSTSDYATSTLIATKKFRVPSGGTKTMTIKGNISGISGTVGPLIASGDLLIVTYDGDSNGSANGNYGKGVSSGQTIDGTSSDVTPTGVRIMKSSPTFAQVDLDSNTLQTDSALPIYRFSVTADDAGDAYMYKFTFNISSSTKTATTTNYGLYAFTDSSFSNEDTTFSTTGLLNAESRYATAITDTPSGGDIQIWMEDGSATTTYEVPAGDTRYFELRANVASVETETGTENIVVKLLGDAAYPTISMAQGSEIDADTNDDFIWSPNSTTSSIATSDQDYTNGYGLLGLPSTNMGSETLTSAN